MEELIKENNEEEKQQFKDYADKLKSLLITNTNTEENILISRIIENIENDLIVKVTFEEWKILQDKKRDILNIREKKLKLTPFNKSNLEVAIWLIGLYFGDYTVIGVYDTNIDNVNFRKTIHDKIEVIDYEYVVDSSHFNWDFSEHFVRPTNKIDSNSFTSIFGTNYKKYLNLEDLNFVLDNLSKSIKVRIPQRTYLMTDASNLVKIGKTLCPNTRLSTFKVGNPTIRIIAILDKNIERLLHIKYSSSRVTGEWFKLSDDDILDIMNDYGFTTKVPKLITSKTVEKYLKPSEEYIDYRESLNYFMSLGNEEKLDLFKEQNQLDNLYTLVLKDLIYNKKSMKVKEELSLDILLKYRFTKIDKEDEYYSEFSNFDYLLEVGQTETGNYCYVLVSEESRIMTAYETDLYGKNLVEIGEASLNELILDGIVC